MPAHGADVDEVRRAVAGARGEPRCVCCWGRPRTTSRLRLDTLRAGFDTWWDVTVGAVPGRLPEAKAGGRPSGR
ncbi:hypothetical protein [Streptomyces swartbergensis]|uniref:hypothetical protein n=1 Tax=Streptomyces swartbergensis TaxID=487165 RepID=UPI00117FEF0B|nr:hypothetical protein [Streptomyces swartbergensis]